MEELTPASFLITLNSNGSISQQSFSGFNCSGDPTEQNEYSSEQLEAGECNEGVIASRKLAINVTSGSSSSTSNTSISSSTAGSEGSDNSGGIVDRIAFGCFAFVGAVALLVV